MRCFVKILNQDEIRIKNDEQIFYVLTSLLNLLYLEIFNKYNLPKCTKFIKLVFPVTDVFNVCQCMNNASLSLFGIYHLLLNCCQSIHTSHSQIQCSYL